MSVSEQLSEITQLLKHSDFSNYISILSVLVAIIAVVVNIIYNHKDRKQYIESLKPLLSFELYESNGLLLLSVKNTGKSEAKNIKLDIKSIRNNGDHSDLELDDLFRRKFMLYPEEEVQGIIAISRVNLNENIFPVVDITISFLKGNDHKKTTYSRTITFKRTLKEKNQLSKIEESIESISYSNNRLANYIEGRTLYVFDKKNVSANNSLFKDMKDAMNNVNRDELIDDDKSQNQFLNNIGLEKNSHQKTFTYSRKQLQESADKISQDKSQNRNRVHEKEELKI